MANPPHLEVTAARGRGSEEGTRAMAAESTKRSNVENMAAGSLPASGAQREATRRELVGVMRVGCFAFFGTSTNDIFFASRVMYLTSRCKKKLCKIYIKSNRGVFVFT